MKLKSVLGALLAAVSLGGCCAKCENKPLQSIAPENAKITEITAQKELQTYLEKCAKKIIVGSDVIQNIYVGDSELAVKNGFSRDKMQNDSFVIKKIGKDIIINGGGTRGVLYGTFDFIENVLGVRFFTPVATYVPDKKVIKAASVDKEFKFHFELRDIYIGKSYNPDGGYYAMSRGMSRGGDTPFDKKFGGSFDYGPPYSCHTFDRYLPAKVYMKKYPHFYSLRNGERYGGQHTGQLCLTNPELREFFTKLVLDNIKETNEKYKKEGMIPPAIYDVSHNDNSRYCMCENCSALAAKERQSGVMIDFVNYIAERVAKVYPDIKLQFFAYQYNAEPPRTLKARDNVIVRICNTGSNQITGAANDKVYSEFFKRWKDFAKHVYIWDYAITYGDMNGGPYPSEFYIPTAYKFYADNNVKGIFCESESPASSDMWELKYYLLTCYAKDPYRTDYEELVNDFYDKYYGAAAKYVYAYRKILHDAAIRKKAVIGWFASGVDFSYIDLETNLKMQAELDKARAAVVNDAELTYRVNRAGLGIDRLLGFEFLGSYQRSTEGNLEKIAEIARNRFWATWDESIKRNAPIAPRTQFDRIKERCETLLALPRSPRKAVKDPNFNVVSFYADEISSIGSSITVIPDKTSEFGSSLKIAIPENNRTHRLPQSCGICSLSQSKEIYLWQFTRKDLKENQWQWLDLKDVLLPEGNNCYVYLTNSWVAQVLLAY
ncbi:MAG: DUF4838 domain-containing protein, partial [Lentisphaeria bacterium]|nr:DUF4838 domain-containing protein [Lentisphaeria bacterium]